MAARLDRYPTAATLAVFGFDIDNTRSSHADEDSNVHDFPLPLVSLEDVKIALVYAKRTLKITRRERVRETVLCVSEQWLCYLRLHLATLRQHFEKQRIDYRRQCNTIDRTLAAMKLKPLNREAKRFYESNVEPLRCHIAEASKLESIALKLHNEALRESAPIESRQAKDASLIGVYNPARGKVEWKYSPSCYVSISGAYNFEKRRVEWFMSRKGCIAAAWNPLQHIIETKVSNKYQSVAGVFNPDLGIVEWQTSAEGKGGSMGGVWNPDTRCVEWKTTDGIEEDIHGAYYDVADKRVVWDVRPCVKSFSSPRPLPLCKFSSNTVWWDGSTYQTTQTQCVPPEPISALSRILTSKSGNT